MANFLYILKRGMDVTPGGKDESKVAVAERLCEEVELERRVKLLVDTTAYTAFAYVAQVRLHIISMGGKLYELYTTDHSIHSTCMMTETRCCASRSMVDLVRTYCGLLLLNSADRLLVSAAGSL